MLRCKGDAGASGRCGLQWGGLCDWSGIADQLAGDNGGGRGCVSARLRLRTAPIFHIFVPRWVVHDILAISASQGRNASPYLSNSEE